MKKLYFTKKDPSKVVFNKDKIIFNFLNLSSLYLFHNSSKFKQVVSSNDVVNFPDGVIISKKLMISKQRGPSFTRRFLMGDYSKNRRHFFIGLEESEIKRFSKITGISEKEIGAYNPPFVSGEEFSQTEKDKMVRIINKSKSDYLWICVGNPKQEILSHQLFNSVNVDKIFNVGAALDFLLKREKESPIILQRLGVEWIYLGITNPKRTLKKIKMSFVALKYLGNIKKK